MATERLPTADFPGYVSPAAIDRNKVRSEDRAVHDWYRFVLSFPPHLVQDYLRRFHIGPLDTVPGSLLRHRHNPGGMQEIRCAKRRN